jgi:hypothetical protein
MTRGMSIGLTPVRCVLSGRSGESFVQAGRPVRPSRLLLIRGFGFDRWISNVDPGDSKAGAMTGSHSRQPWGLF